MRSELLAPEASIWLDWEYSRRLALAGVRRLPRLSGSFEDTLTRVETFARKHGDTELLEGNEKLKHDKLLSRLLQVQAEFGLAGHFYDHSHALEPALRRVLGDLSYPTVVRELPTQEFNACTLNTASGYLILVNTGVPYFINQCGKIAGYACPEFVRFPSGGAYEPERAPDGVERMEGGALMAFCGLALSMQLCGYLRDAEAGTLSFLPQSHPAKFEILRDVVISAERFMIAHEHGHIVKDHLVAQTIADDVPIRATDQELEADAFGVKILMAPEINVGTFRLRKDDKLAYEAYVERAIAGVALFFGADHLVELTMDRLDTQKRPMQRTHPPAISRWEALKPMLASDFPEQMSFAESLFSFYLNIAPIGADFCAMRLAAHDNLPASSGEALSQG